MGKGGALSDGVVKKIIISYTYVTVLGGEKFFEPSALSRRVYLSSVVPIGALYTLSLMPGAVYSAYIYPSISFILFIQSGFCSRRYLQEQHHDQHARDLGWGGHRGLRGDQVRLLGGFPPAERGLLALIQRD